LIQKRELLLKVITSKLSPEYDQKEPDPQKQLARKPDKAAGSKSEQTFSEKRDFFLRWVQPIESFHTNMVELYDLRIRLIKEVTQNLRARITGVDIDGVKELQGEIDHISLRSQVRSFYAPHAIRHLINDAKQAPLPALGKMVELAIAVILFSWWRKWAPEGLIRLRKSLRDRHPKKRIHLNAAWLLWYLERIRKPIEWMILLSIFFSIIDIPETKDLDEILWANIRWVLITWFVILFINTTAERHTAGFKSAQSKLRLRSFRLVAGWVLILMLGLALAEKSVGQGALYAWIKMLVKVLLWPGLLLLIHWWRPEIFKRMEREGTQQTWKISILKHQTGIIGYKNAAIGGAYLMIQGLRRQIIKGITRFEGGRHLLANLTRREALRTMDGQRGLINSAPIPKTLRQRLMEEDRQVVQKVAEKEFARLLELDKQGEGGMAIIIAERGGGKSGLLKRLQMSAEGRSLILDCPPGGYRAFLKTLGKTLNLNPDKITPSGIEARLLESNIRVIGIDNLHRLSKPVIGGQKDLNRLSDLYREIGLKILWVIGHDLAAWQYIQRLRENRTVIDEMIELPRWDEDQIRALVELRCNTVGIKPDFNHLVLPRQFDDIDHDSITAQNQVGFYRMLWNAADGNPAVALRMWTESIEVTPEGKYVVCLPVMPTLKNLEKVNLSVLLVLRVITQSGMAEQKDIIQSLKLPEAEVANAIRYAAKCDWIEDRNGFYRITWRWFRPITRVLARHNLLVRKFLGDLK
jgi:hypothetical protein